MLRLDLPIAVLLIVVAAFVAGGCEDSPRPKPDPTETATAPATADTGTTPVLGGHVIELIPAHGASVASAATRTLDPMRPQPPCFVADFTGLAEQGQWFRVMADGREVTTELTWVVPDSPDSGRPPRACYATEAGLGPGPHTLVIVVRHPFDSTAPALETITWSFTVTP